MDGKYGISAWVYLEKTLKDVELRRIIDNGNVLGMVTHTKVAKFSLF